MTTIAKSLLILILGAFLLVRSGTFLQFFLQHIVATGVVIALVVVAFNPQRGSNRVLQGLFAWAGVIAAVVFVFWYVSFERETKGYIVNQVCHMGGFQIMSRICRALGVR